MFWNRYPIARLLLPLLAGIIIAIAFDLSFLLPLIVFLILLLALAVVVLFYYKKMTYRLRWVTGFIISLFFLFSGYQLTALKNCDNDRRYFGKALTGDDYALAYLNEPVQVREKVCKSVVEVASMKSPAGWRAVSGKAILYFEKDSNAEMLNYGDGIILKTAFSEFNPPMNPQEYDYKNYLKYQSVEYSGYIPGHCWKKVSVGNGNPLKSFAYKIRDKLLRVLSERKIDGDEYAVVSALLVGYTDKLDPELIKDYQGTGAVHILSVSGLHVGIVYLVLNFLLQFFDRFRYGRIPKAFMLLVCIWFYALLTGMSPSVMRAAAMFSFVSLGKAFRQTPNIYNTIAASAFVLLLFDPYMVMSVGFQLSYLAVIGIVSLYPHIRKAWTPGFWLAKKLWSLIAVSLAAQIVTFPLCLYYFHQFPNYFLLTNIVAVPLSGLVIYLGIAVLALSFIPTLSILLAKVLSWLLMFLNGSISFIEDLPYAVTRSVPFDFMEMLLVYAIVIGLCAFLLQRKGRLLVGVAAFMLILLIAMTIKNYSALTQKEIIVYNVNKHSAVDIINGKTVYFICDSALIYDIKKQDFHIMNNRCQLQSRNVFPVLTGDSHILDQANGFCFHNNFIDFAGKKLGLINKAVYNTTQLVLDFLIVANNPDISVGELQRQFRPGIIVFDASNSNRNIRKWTAQCAEAGIPCYSTRSSGAWVNEIND